MALANDSDPGVLTNSNSTHEVAARLEHQLGNITSGTTTKGTVTAGQVVVVDSSKDIGTFGNVAVATLNSAYPVLTAGISFTEDGSGTSYIGTVEIAAGTIVHDIGFVSTVLWDGTSASLDIGDDDDDNGWFAGVNLKATDLLVGEVLCAADNGTWGGKNGAYLVDATGRRGRTTSGVDSGWYYGAASEVIFKVTPGAADGSAGRSFGWVRYSIPTFTASTNT